MSLRDTWRFAIEFRVRSVLDTSTSPDRFASPHTARPMPRPAQLQVNAVCICKIKKLIYLLEPNWNRKVIEFFRTQINWIWFERIDRTRFKSFSAFSIRRTRGRHACTRVTHTHKVPIWAHVRERNRPGTTTQRAAFAIWEKFKIN